MTPRARLTYSRQFLRWHIRQERIAGRLVRARFRVIAGKVVNQLNVHGTAWLAATVDTLITEHDHQLMLQGIYTAVGVDAANREYERLLPPAKSAVVPMLTKDRNEPKIPLLPKPVPNNLMILARSESWRQRMVALAANSTSALRITQMTAKTKQLVRDVLTRGAEQVWDVRTIARRLRAVLADPVRALLIARTETTRAANAGAEAGAVSSNLTLNKVWIATADGRTRDAHRAMLSSKPVAANGFFVVGGINMRYPGDPAGGAANCCRCRCAVSYVPITNPFN